MSATNGSAAVTSTGVEAALKEAERVVKKQKVCSARTSELLSRLIEAVETAHALIQDDTCDPAAVLEALWTEVSSWTVSDCITADVKELHGAVGKLAKAVEKAFPVDVCAAYRKIPMDRATLDLVIAEHLYHEGAFEVADAFVAEAGVPGAAQLKAPYASMHTVLEHLRRRNLQPALAWAAENTAALRAAATVGGRFRQPGPSGGAPGPCDFEFALHRLAFLQALQQQGQAAALQYARHNLATFQHTHMQQLQRLMGALCFARRAAAGKAGPYADLFSDDLWETFCRDFIRQSCALLGQGQDSPLLVTVAAGAAALPTLLKLASVVSQAQPSTAELAGQADELPVEVPLGREFVFHSIFACPVSREQATPENPPMLLPCGHCMCRQSIIKIAKSVSRSFKCPYCPVEATMQQCMQLRFPEEV